MDAPGIDRAELWRNLEELDTINRWLGGHRVTLGGLEQLLPPGDRVWRVVDVGCGGGDTLSAIAAWARRSGRRVELTGVDLKPECLEFAARSCEGLGARFICEDYRLVEGDWDVVTTSLFCHHLSDAQLLEFLRWSRRSARVGLLINDLHRHPLAWLGIRVLTTALSGSRLVRNDGPVSVLRAFKRSELEAALREAGWSQARVRWAWAFRYQVLGHVEVAR